ncbi:MAG TPA: endopeptidase La [Clostridia bacterium]|nr:endopeptidase La [Clostridia bacterium]
MKEKKFIEDIYPMIPLRGITVFPHMTIHFDVGRGKSIAALESAMEDNQLIFLTTQKDAMVEEPGEGDIFTTGTISRVKQLLRLPGKTVRVLVEGVERGEIVSYETSEPFFRTVIRTEVLESGIPSEREEALRRKAIEAFESYAALAGRISPDTVFSIITTEDTDKLSDMIAGSMNLKTSQRQELLEEKDSLKRLSRLLPIIYSEIQILELEKDISSKVKGQIDEMQKQYYLKEQLKIIREELGESDSDGDDEISEYYDKLDKHEYPAEVKEKIEKELSRLVRMSPISAEATVSRTYVEWLLNLPWDKTTEEKLEPAEARRILERDHYGLEKVKERIIEYIASRKMAEDFNSPILCLVGPPGVGKTSIVKSIAEAVNRKYVRMSLGGVRDEAEIRGHRRTYVGSMPGRITKAISQAGTMNPLVLFDEIDKMSSDFRGDPASAMLEVLDAEQNYSFRDHYLEVPMDLRQVMFITTANSTDTIPRPLLDRMEVIYVSGYTGEEKQNIARKFLIPKQMKKHGLKKSQLRISDSALTDIINSYTRESGVRSLEREIASVCRKAVTKLVEENMKSVSISYRNIEEYFGPRKFNYEMALEKDEIGIARGLAWTPVGGDTLSIEVNIMPGSGKLELTGMLGDVMKESAKAAYGYIRSRADKLGLDPDFYKELDIHVHVPEGAVPKDGPSAGITLATAIISALTKLPVKKEVAMTGEITLRGRVLPIGGLKEKLTAARRAGMKTVIIPEMNKSDLAEIHKEIMESLEIVTVKSMDQVLDIALINK